MYEQTITGVVQGSSTTLYSRRPDCMTAKTYCNKYRGKKTVRGGCGAMWLADFKKQILLMDEGEEVLEHSSSLEP